MKEGDILVLENDPRKDLTAKVEGQPKFAGIAGKYGNRKVFKVERILNPSSTVGT